MRFFQNPIQENYWNCLMVPGRHHSKAVFIWLDKSCCYKRAFSIEVICQKQWKTTVEYQGSLRQWVTVLIVVENNALWLSKKLKAEQKVHWDCEISKMFLGIMKTTCIPRPLCMIRKDLRRSYTLKTDLEDWHEALYRQKQRLRQSCKMPGYVLKADWRPISYRYLRKSVKSLVDH